MPKYSQNICDELKSTMVCCVDTKLGHTFLIGAQIEHRTPNEQPAIPSVLVWIGEPGCKPHLHVTVRLCVYGLAHTCTPLLMNIFYLAQLCVNGLVHTCTPLQIN